MKVPGCAIHRRGGASLLEIVLAFSIFAVAFLVFMDDWKTGSVALAKSRGYVEATAVARAQMENVMAQGFLLARSATGSVTIENATMGVTSSITFDYSVTVTEVDASTVKALVRVEWQDGRERRVVQTATLLCDV